MIGISCRLVFVSLLLTSLVPVAAQADVVLLLAEPYGRAGSFNPSGHVGVYLTRVCADTPIVLRRCREGEAGVVISRYNRVSGFDWAAIPIVPYLYAVERAEDVPAVAEPETVAALRDAYRRAHLLDVVPDLATGGPPVGNWHQLVGAAYDRNIIALSIRTTPDQDDAFIEEMNAAPNRHRFSLLFRNCADFARDVVNHYYPRAIRGNAVADLGVTTPKHIARKFVDFGSRRPGAGLTVSLIPQIPGNRADSGRARGIMESLVKSKKYVVPLAVVQPWVPVGLAAGYLVSGRFNPHKYVSEALAPADVERRALRENGTDLLGATESAGSGDDALRQRP
jgi:hypothetical protein